MSRYYFLEFSRLITEVSEFEEVMKEIMRMVIDYIIFNLILSNNFLFLKRMLYIRNDVKSIFYMP